MAIQPTPELRAFLTRHCDMPATATDDLCRSTLAKALGDGTLDFAKLRELLGIDQQGFSAAVKSQLISSLQGKEANMTTNANSPTVDQVLGASSHLRVKDPSESYCQKRTAGLHVKTGRPVQDERGRTAELPSQYDLARIGALCKWHAARDGLSVALSDHEKALMEEMFAKDVWAGMYQGRFQNEVPGMAVKALLSDSLSGGINLNPHWFDDAIIQKPLLNGELYPFVDLRPSPAATWLTALPSATRRSNGASATEPKWRCSIPQAWSRKSARPFTRSRAPLRLAGTSCRMPPWRSVGSLRSAWVAGSSASSIRPWPLALRPAASPLASSTHRASVRFPAPAVPALRRKSLTTKS
jgi:hypothetical protein